MRVRYTPRAFADREQIFDYLHQLSPSGARTVLESIREAVAPYKIFYRVREDIVEVIHIRHTARRPWRGGD